MRYEQPNRLHRTSHRVQYEQKLKRPWATYSIVCIPVYVGADRQGDIVNELIAKLYDQALMLESNGDYVAGELDPERFAELIVREVIRICDRRGAYHVMDDIIDHFGVEI